MSDHFPASNVAAVAFRMQRLPLAVALSLLTLATGAAKAQTPQADTTVKPASEAAPAKDVVLDRPANTAPAPVTTAVQPPAVVHPPLPVVRTDAAMSQRVAALSGNLAELGLSMLRAPSQGQSAGGGSTNQVVSPVSLAAALGLVHAGTAGAGATEISALLGPATASGTAFQRDLPAVLRMLTQQTPELASANRLWLDSKLAKSLSATYVAAVSQRYQADGALLNFSQPEEARKAINGWASEHTGKRIQSLLPAGALTPTSKAVLTNALHFRAAWAAQFNPTSTRDKPFFTTDKTAKQVPTLSQRMVVRAGVFDNATVIDIPFDGGRFSFTVAMPPKGHTLQAFEQDLSGHDVVAWSRKLPSVDCLVELPKFKIDPVSVALKPWLQAQGVTTSFGDAADFTPLMGAAGKAIALENVYQSAGIAVDENGAEASAATAAVMGVKSFRPQAEPLCKVDRPFVFAVTHVATGAPVFLGKVVNP
jgi:serpin B